jgi:hypothetical protein
MQLQPWAVAIVVYADAILRNELPPEATRTTVHDSHGKPEMGGAVELRFGGRTCCVDRLASTARGENA